MRSHKEPSQRVVVSAAFDPRAYDMATRARGGPAESGWSDPDANYVDLAKEPGLLYRLRALLGD